eukprot:5693860-Pyramimonas_sp.AAC.1
MTIEHAFDLGEYVPRLLIRVATMAHDVLASVVNVATRMMNQVGNTSRIPNRIPTMSPTCA